MDIRSGTHSYRLSPSSFPTASLWSFKSKSCGRKIRTPTCPSSLWWFSSFQSDGKKWSPQKNCPNDGQCLSERRKISYSRVYDRDGFSKHVDFKHGHYIDDVTHGSCRNTGKSQSPIDHSFTSGYRFCRQCRRYWNPDWNSSQSCNDRRLF